MESNNSVVGAAESEQEIQAHVEPAAEAEQIASANPPDQTLPADGPADSAEQAAPAENTVAAAELEEVSPTDSPADSAAEVAVPETPAAAAQPPMDIASDSPADSAAEVAVPGTPAAAAQPPMDIASDSPADSAAEVGAPETLAAAAQPPMDIAGDSPADSAAEAAASGEVAPATEQPAAEQPAASAADTVVNSVEPSAPGEPQPAEAGGESMEALLDEQPNESGVKKGDILEGTIVRTSAVEVVVDVGLKSEGVILSKELERMDKEALEQLQVGNKVLVSVVSPEDKNGNVVLSLARAQEEQDWRNAVALRESGEIFAGKIDGFNKGGLIVKFGRVRGFVPESQVSRDRRRRVEGLDPQNKWVSMRGEDINVKVLEVDQGLNRLILSERDAAPQLRDAQKSRLLDELQVGDVRVGHVKSIADFGVFVDVGGADGLVHLTELSWKHISKPSDILSVGQEVKVEVISVDRERKRIGLSIKRQEEDPWTALTKQYAMGQLVQGTVTKLTKFGAFARLVDAPEIEGLIHISELADHRVNHPRDVVTEGDVLTLRVVKIDSENRRMGLSLKRVDSPDYLDGDFVRATRPGEVTTDIADFEAASLREDDRRRDRKKGKKPTGRKPGGREFEEFEDSEF